MTYFVSVFSGKGGVGKSTLNCLLADVLSYSKFTISKNIKKNIKVLVLDMDDQSSAATYLLGENKVIEMGQEQRSLPDVIAGLENYDKLKELLPNLIGKRNRTHSTGLEIGEVDVIHSVNDQPIVNFLKTANTAKCINIAKNLKRYFDHYDFVFIDIPGSNIPNYYSLIALLLAEHYILVSSCSAMEIFSLPRTYDLLDRIKKIKNKGFDHYIHGTVLNMVDKRGITYRKRKNEIREIMLNHTDKGFYDESLSHNNSVQSIGVKEAISFNQVWDTYGVKVKRLASQILSNLGLVVKGGSVVNRD
jgi:cellulose biosynthesis protein BcsQ